MLIRSKNGGRLIKDGRLWVEVEQPSPKQWDVMFYESRFVDGPGVLLGKYDSEMGATRAVAKIFMVAKGHVEWYVDLRVV